MCLSHLLRFEKPNHLKQEMVDWKACQTIAALKQGMVDWKACQTIAAMTTLESLVRNGHINNDNPLFVIAGETGDRVYLLRKTRPVFQLARSCEEVCGFEFYDKNTSDDKLTIHAFHMGRIPCVVPMHVLERHLGTFDADFLGRTGTQVPVHDMIAALKETIAVMSQGETDDDAPLTKPADSFCAPRI